MSSTAGGQDSDADFAPKFSTGPGKSSTFAATADPTPVAGLSDTDYEKVRAKISELISTKQVVLFMKGSPDSPQCGFSRNVVKILAAAGVDDYVFADVLKNGALREGIKKFSDWPTIPQLYIAGEFVGGSDIITEMWKNGELSKLLEAKAIVKKGGEAGGDKH